MATIDQTYYDFIDFGCSNGGSLRLGIEKFGGKRGLGIDIDPRKVAEAQKNGYNAKVADVTMLSKKDLSSRFVLMSHFLEHLPGYEHAKKCICSSVEIAEEFVYIQQPYFDADGQLFHHKLKFYWSDWSGHKFHMTALDFHNILNPLLEQEKIDRFVIYGDQIVNSSANTSIHSIFSPVNQHHFDDSKHLKKASIEFDFPCYRQIIVLIITGKKTLFDSLNKKIRFDRVIFDSRGELSTTL